VTHIAPLDTPCTHLHAKRRWAKNLSFDMQCHTHLLDARGELLMQGEWWGRAVFFHAFSMAVHLGSKEWEVAAHIAPPEVLHKPYRQ